MFTQNCPSVNQQAFTDSCSQHPGLGVQGRERGRGVSTGFVLQKGQGPRGSCGWPWGEGEDGPRQRELRAQNGVGGGGGRKEKHVLGRSEQAFSWPARSQLAVSCEASHPETEPRSLVCGGAALWGGRMSPAASFKLPTWCLQAQS